MGVVITRNNKFSSVVVPTATNATTPSTASASSQQTSSIASQIVLSSAGEAATSSNAIRPAPDAALLRVMLSGFDTAGRDKAVAVLQSLGVGVASDSDSNWTHLVIGERWSFRHSSISFSVKPQRSEKFMVAVARGRWILHPSFIDACERERRFVNVSGSCTFF